MRQNAITLTSLFEAIFVRVCAENGDFQDLDSVLSSFRGCVMESALIELVNYSFEVYGGLVCPVPRRLTPNIRIEQIIDDLKVIEREHASMFDSGFTSKNLNFLVKKGTRLITELIHLDDNLDFNGSTDYSIGYRGFFSGKETNSFESNCALTGWNDASSLAQTGMNIFVNDGYRIRFNPLFDEYQVSHLQIGACIESFDTYSEAVKYCK